MKKVNLYLILSLSVSLFIYVFYRTEKTVVNGFLINLISAENYNHLKSNIQHFLPLHEFFIFSLPEGLWIFCITLTSKNFYIQCLKKKMNLAYVPLIVAVGFEFFQLFHFTNGRFDFVDILSSLLFWMLGYFLVETDLPKQNLFQSFNYRTATCAFSYLIVYLAHVWK